MFVPVKDKLDKLVALTPDDQEKLSHYKSIVPAMIANCHKAHKKVFSAKDKGRQCVHTLKAFKEYNQLFRRIVEAENKDARFLYT